MGVVFLYSAISLSRRAHFSFSPASSVRSSPVFISAPLRIFFSLSNASSSFEIVTSLSCNLLSTKIYNVLLKSFVIVLIQTYFLTNDLYFKESIWQSVNH